MMGSKKAAVFPDPVCAQAIKSLPAMMMGIAFFCTGVGTLYPDLVTFSINNGLRPAAANWVISLGLFSPVTATGMFSYLAGYNLKSNTNCKQKTHLAKLIPEIIPSLNSSSATMSSLGTYDS